MKLDPGILSRKAPVDCCSLLVAALLLGSSLIAEGRSVRNAPVQALFCQDTEFDFGHIEPGTVLRGIDEFKLI